MTPPRTDQHNLLPPREEGSPVSDRDPLLQPLHVGPLQIRNRVFSTGHALRGFMDTGTPGERYAAYHEEKARGGVGLTIIGGSSNVSPDSANVFGQINAGTDDILPFYENITERVRRHGAAVMIQITHMGRRSQANVGTWLPSLAPSPIRERAHRSFPKEMESFDFARIIDDYAAAAERAKRGGFDGIEIIAVAGHLPDQFWAERTNKRTDAYGGSIENRMRFSIELLEQLRKRVGDDFVIGFRVPGDEGTSAGIGLEQGQEIVSRLAETGIPDFFNVTYGAGFNQRELSNMIPSFGRPAGANVDMAAQFKRLAAGRPIFHAGRIADAATARWAVREQLVDMVGMTRAHIADPHIVRKIEAGEEERIRPCVGAAFCLSAEPTTCLHNPSTGRESELPQTTPATEARGKKVVVVGGGPGGMELARVAAERGHRVTLFEAQAELGGQWRLATRAERQSEKLAIVTWLSGELEHLGVNVRRNTFAEAADVLGLDPDVIVVATGGLPNTSVLESGNELVTSTWDAMSGEKIGSRVLIYDDHGAEQAVTTAEKLALAGHSVEIVSPDVQIGIEVPTNLIPDYLRNLYAHGVALTPNTEVVSVAKVDGVLAAHLKNAYTDSTSQRTVDTVIIEHGTLPVTDLFEELRPGSTNFGQLDLDAFVAVTRQRIATNPGGAFQLFRIGDAVSHRGVHAAILDARRLGQAL